MLFATDVPKPRAALWVNSHRRAGRRGRVRVVRAGGREPALNASSPQHQHRRAAGYRLPDIASLSPSARRGSSGRMPSVGQHWSCRLRCRDSHSTLRACSLQKYRAVCQCCTQFRVNNMPTRSLYWKLWSIMCNRCRNCGLGSHPDQLRLGIERRRCGCATEMCKLVEPTTLASVT